MHTLDGLYQAVVVKLSSPLSEIFIRGRTAPRVSLHQKVGIPIVRLNLSDFGFPLAQRIDMVGSPVILALSESSRYRGDPSLYVEVNQNLLVC